MCVTYNWRVVVDNMDFPLMTLCLVILKTVFQYIHHSLIWLQLLTTRPQEAICLTPQFWDNGLDSLYLDVGDGSQVPSIGSMCNLYFEPSWQVFSSAESISRKYKWFGHLGVIDGTDRWKKSLCDKIFQHWKLYFKNQYLKE